MQVAGVNMGSSDVNSAIALLTLLADPKKHQDALKDLAAQVKVCEEALASAQTAQQIADAQLKESEKNLTAVTAVEERVSKKQEELDAAQTKFTVDQANFNKAKAVQQEEVEKQKKELLHMREVNAAEKKDNTALKARAEAELAEAKKIRQEGEALKKQYEDALAKLKAIVPA